LAALPRSPASTVPNPSVAEHADLDLHTLLSQFVALRHEVNLQTKAVRAQQEQNGETLQQLQDALGALRQAQAVASHSVDERMRPLLKTLTDLYDSLALASREIHRVQETVLPLLQKQAAPPAPEPIPKPEPPAVAPPSFWQRWFGQPAPSRTPEATARETEARQEQARQSQEISERIQQMLTSLITGYTMSTERIERALRQHGLQTIPTVGEPFDPERMEVLEAVAGSGRPSGEVLEEVRRGYLWNNRVFRYAQVRVARS
jgi:molecular chaperone GrpE